jgi:hypothetical protein
VTAAAREGALPTAWLAWPLHLAGRWEFFHAERSANAPPERKQTNQTTCKDITRFNIRVAFARTSAGVSTTSLPMTALPPVTPFTKLRRCRSKRTWTNSGEIAQSG